MGLWFSLLGLLYLLLLFFPNLLWTKRKPRDYEVYAARENRLLFLLERAGEALVCYNALFVPNGPAGWPGWLLLSLLLIALYEVWWVRYFRSPREMADFYRSLLGIPVAGATLPVLAFFLLGVYERNVLLLLSAVILGVGHIGIHLGHRRELAERRAL